MRLQELTQIGEHIGEIAGGVPAAFPEGLMRADIGAAVDDPRQRRMTSSRKSRGDTDGNTGRGLVGDEDGIWVGRAELCHIRPPMSK